MSLLKKTICLATTLSWTQYTISNQQEKSVYLIPIAKTQLLKKFSATNQTLVKFTVSLYHQNITGFAAKLPSTQHVLTTVP
jgi:hypothetical protein